MDIKLFDICNPLLTQGNSKSDQYLITRKCYSTCPSSAEKWYFCMYDEYIYIYIYYDIYTK